MKKLFRVHKKRDGFLVVSKVTGRAEFLGFFEGLHFRLRQRLPTRFSPSWAFDGSDHICAAQFSEPERIRAG